MRTGDLVKHKPSGEEWIVARVAGEDVFPCGWPCTMALKDDCEVIHACHDEDHDYWVAQMKKLPEFDPRFWAEYDRQNSCDEQVI